MGLFNYKQNAIDTSSNYNGKATFSSGEMNPEEKFLEKIDNRNGRANFYVKL